MSNDLSAAARGIWQAAVDAVRPRELLLREFEPGSPLSRAVERAHHIRVVGAGKAGAAMSAALEEALSGRLDRLEGLVNVPADSVRPLSRIRLLSARPAGSNHPTAEGVAGTEQMLRVLAGAGPEDVAICLLSGGGSALLPAPAEGVTLADKQAVTKLLHACGATIREMNAVRKHLSRVKGGGLARAFRGRELFSLILSDVVGDPLDVIASGPTAADPTTFADAVGVLDRYALRDRVPAAVRERLEEGAAGRVPETVKQLPDNVHNRVVGNNRLALDAARRRAESLGYRVLDLGSFVEGETAQVATAVAGIVRSIRHDRRPIGSPACILVGGETTVTLGPGHGKGGRNQEFVLALALQLGPEGMHGVAVLSGGTDGEDGPTDAAGAVLDERHASAIVPEELAEALYRHDAYPALDKLGGLIRTGLTETNVMDVRLILIR